MNEFNTLIDQLLSNRLFTNNRNIILGNFNINLLEQISHLPTNSFITTMQSNNYFPQLYSPTRLLDNNTTASPSLIDHIWTNLNEPSTSGIFHFPLGDHLSIFMNIPTLNKPENEIHKIGFRLQNVNKLKFTETLSNINWNLYLNSNNTDTNCNLFLNKLYSIYYACFPKVSKTVKSKRLQKPWITQSIINSIKH